MNCSLSYSHIILKLNPLGYSLCKGGANAVVGSLGAFLPYSCSSELGFAGNGLGFSLPTSLACKIGVCAAALRQGFKGRDPAPTLGGLFPVFITCVAVMPRSLRHGTLGFVFHSRRLGEGEARSAEKIRREGAENKSQTTQRLDS